MADHVDRALGRPDDPGEHLQQRALARAVRADDRQRLAALDAEVDVAERPELLDLAAPEHLADRLADRRLLGEPQVVPDAQVGRADRERRRLGLPYRRRPAQAPHQMTFAKFGSRRLKTIVVSAEEDEAGDEQDGQRDRSSGGPLRRSSSGVP